MTPEMQADLVRQSREFFARGPQPHNHRPMGTTMDDLRARCQRRRWKMILRTWADTAGSWSQ